MTANAWLSSPPEPAESDKGDGAARRQRLPPRLIWLMHWFEIFVLFARS